MKYYCNKDRYNLIWNGTIVNGKQKIITWLNSLNKLLFSTTFGTCIEIPHCIFLPHCSKSTKYGMYFVETRSPSSHSTIMVYPEGIIIVSRASLLIAPGEPRWIFTFVHVPWVKTLSFIFLLKSLFIIQWLWVFILCYNLPYFYKVVITIRFLPLNNKKKTTLGSSSVLVRQAQSVEQFSLCKLTSIKFVCYFNLILRLN